MDVFKNLFGLQTPDRNAWVKEARALRLQDGDEFRLTLNALENAYHTAQQEHPKGSAELRDAFNKLDAYKQVAKDPFGRGR